ncbi:MAG: disulfide oxidoreductase, partial [Pseudomonadota bacterium]
IAALFEPLIALRDDEAVSGLAKGVAFRLIEGLGVLERRPIADDVKALDQEARTQLRKHGVRFGQHSIFMPALLKPAPTRLRLVLWGLKEGLDEIPGAPPPGHVTIPTPPDAPEGFFIRAGYRAAGVRAIRIDMLERLADLLRDQDGRAGFEATPDMLSITGMTLEQFADLMQGLGFAAERGERPKPAPKPEPAAEAAAKATDDAAAPGGESDEGGGSDATCEEAAPQPAETAAEAPPADASPAEAAPAEPAAAEEDPSKDEAREEATEASGEEPSQATDEPAPATDEPAAPAETEETAAAEPVAAEVAAGAEAGEPEIEVYYTFTVARRPQRGGRDGQRRGGRAAKPGGAQTQGKGKRPPKGGKPGGKGRREKDDGGKPRVFTAKPKAEKGPDPDSPFAVLQRLKT